MASPYIELKVTRSWKYKPLMFMAHYLVWLLLVDPDDAAAYVVEHGLTIGVKPKRICH